MRRIGTLNLDSKGKRMRKAAGEDEVSDQNSEIDRISELPDYLIHQIFDYIGSPREVARSQFLSKYWKRAFDSYGDVDFDYRWFLGENGSARFRQYVEKSLATRLDRIDRFRLWSREADLESLARWIRSAMDNGARELDIDLDSSQASELPIGLTRSSSITSLKIAGYPLRSLVIMRMCNLKRISIDRSGYLDQSCLKKIEENFPLLEDLRLSNCQNLVNLQISSLLKLKNVEVQFCSLVQDVKVSAPNLETFRLHGENYMSCRVDLHCSGNLRNLSLKKDCQRLMSRHAHQNRKIWSLQSSEKEEDDAPNLYSFKYQLPRASRLFDVKFSFGKSFLEFEGSMQFKAIVYTTKSMKIFEDIPRESEIISNPREADEFFLANGECRMDVTPSSFEATRTVSNWLSESHGESLVLLSSSNNLLVHLINRMVMQRRKEPSCCGICTEKCWRHYVKDVLNVSNFDNVENTAYEFAWRSKGVFG